MAQRICVTGVFFNALIPRQPDRPLPLALAGYFQARTRADIEAGLARLNDAVNRDLGALGDSEARTSGCMAGPCSRSG
jgi:hypothetical protein